MLVCEELALRAREDLRQGADREATLQLTIALDAAVAELAADGAAARLADRLRELADARDRTRAAADAALNGPLSAAEREHVVGALALLERALRARAAALD